MLACVMCVVSPQSRAGAWCKAPAPAATPCRRSQPCLRRGGLGGPLPSSPARRRTAAAGASASGSGTATSSAAGVLAAEVNAACNDALRTMLACDEGRVPALEERLRGLRLRALEGQDAEADRLLRVVSGMLRHTVLAEAGELGGPAAAAFNRLANQVAGCDWKLVPEGQSVEGAAAQEPRFSTWEEVAEKQRARRAGAGGGGGAAAPAGAVHTRFYDLLGVPPTASQPDIKAAYRRLALRLHPDVSDAPDASARFAELAAAYDVLSDAASRSLYDRHGAEGMARHAGASAGRGNAASAWDEFKPFKRENKRTRARDASAASCSSADEEAAAQAAPGEAGGARGGADRWAGMPVAGAVVEYPLSSLVQQELQDGRSHGVGLLVGRNCDRGDASRLPDEALDLCEVEPLRQEEPGSHRWLPDELSPSAYVRLGELRAVPVDGFDQRFDVWTITAPLSDGCGGPELPEEVML